MPTAQSEFIAAHFTSSGKNSTAESATTMRKFKFNKCWLGQPEFSWLKAVKIMNYDAQCVICQRTFNLGTLSVKALVSHTKLEKYQLTSKRHAITHSCTPLSPVPGPSCPVLLDPNSAPRLPSIGRSIQTFCGSTPTLKFEVLPILNTVSVCVCV